MKETFDIFSGTQKKPLWIESVEGLCNARERLQQFAAEKPGPYFIFCTASQKSMAEIETFALPQLKPLTKAKAKSSGA